MMTTLVRSQTLALLPNSRLNTPMVRGPQTSWVMRMSTLTQTLSPGSTCALPPARASSFSVKVIGPANWRGAFASANGFRGSEEGRSHRGAVNLGRLAIERPEIGMLHGMDLQ